MKKQFFSQPTLFVSILLSILMVFNEVPLLYFWFCFGVIGWKFLSEKGKVKKFPRFLTATLSALSFVLIVARYRTLFSQEAALSLLIVLTSLKIMDYEEDRDHKFVCLLAFILLILKSLFSYEIYWLIPTFVSFFMVWVSLTDVQVSGKYQFIFRLFARSFPIAIGFFLLFPRFVVPWAMQRQQPQKASVGFSNQMNPGDVSQMAQSNELAFRVKFLNERKVELLQMYWAGSVLNVSKGLAWSDNLKPINRAKEPSELLREEDLESRNNIYHYQVLLEPREHEFLFGLDSVIKLSLGNRRLQRFSENTFRVMNEKKTLSYWGYSILYDDPVKEQLLPSKEVAAEDLEAYLKTAELPPQTQAFVAEQLEKKLTSEENLMALKKFFTEEKFRYTLSPGQYIGISGLDEFLFKRKLGFCEHFAGAFATLARSLGIPSRVIIGYQGGEFNPIGDYWVFRQNDAHAWVSVYLNKHWERVDPTAWVAPLRFDVGAQEFFKLSESERFEFSGDQVRSRVQNNFMVDQALFFFDSLNYKYSSFLLDFDQEGQRVFLQENKKEIFVALILLMSIITVYTVLRMKKPVPLRISQRQVNKFMSKLRKQGIQKAKDQPPLEFLEYVGRRRPELKSQIDEISRLYEDEMYREKHENEKFNFRPRV